MRRSESVPIRCEMMNKWDTNRIHTLLFAKGHKPPLWLIGECANVCDAEMIDVSQRMEKRNFKENERQLECTVEITATQSPSSDQRRKSSLVSSKTPDIKRVFYNKQAQDWTYQTDPSPPTSWLTSTNM
ncbi:unnamed protein product [Nezara viridula]|uniref:Uncharacterized protein n=1 Tax=Nezara viridula TaxID=85310 RepID=A0A9P0HPY9_NEZVI|nr:unnamed protein product [Nezara viridula]